MKLTLLKAALLRKLYYLYAQKEGAWMLIQVVLLLLVIVILILVV